MQADPSPISLVRVRLAPDGRTLYVALSGSPKVPPGGDESNLPPPDRAADGIGVSVLCPGVVATDLGVTSARNRS
jgi:hypothetical protein